MNNNLVKLTKEQLQELKHYSAWKQIARLVMLITLYITLSYLGVSLNNVIAWLPIWGLQGILLSCSLVVVHDCAHYTFFKKKLACRILGGLWGSILWVNYSLYRCLHLEHHKYTNVPGDTQRARVYKNNLHYLLSILHFKFIYRFIELSVKAIFNNHVYCAKSKKIRLAIKIDSILLLSILLIEIIIFTLYPIKFIHLYILPMIFYLIITFFLTTAEHAGCDLTCDKTLNVRSIKSNFIFRLLFWNFNFHAEHHAYPAIPSANLAKVHKLIGSSFPYIEQSYIKLHIKLFAKLVKRMNNG